MNFHVCSEIFLIDFSSYSQFFLSPFSRMYYMYIYIDGKKKGEEKENARGEKRKRIRGEGEKFHE